MQNQPKTNTALRYLHVERVLLEWAIVAYKTPDPAQNTSDGSVWLSGFDSREQAEMVASKLQDALLGAIKEAA